MTEQQLRAVKEFGNLPIYDEDDEAGCDSLNAVRVCDTRYEGASPEAEDDVQFWNLLHDPRYELKGAIRYSPTDVRAVFWLKRDGQ
jgi:hypothetical protein